MPVSIDEVTAEVGPSGALPPESPRPEGQGTSPVIEFRRQREAMDHLTIRAARLRAD